MFVGLLNILLLASYCCYCSGFRICNAGILLHVRPAHTKISTTGSKQVRFARPKFPARFPFVRSATDPVVGAEIADVDRISEEEAGTISEEEAGTISQEDAGTISEEDAGTKGSKTDDPDEASQLSAFQRLVSSFGTTVRKLVPFAPNSDPEAANQNEEWQGELAGAVLDDEKISELFGGGEEEEVVEEEKVVPSRTKALGVGHVQSPVTRVDPVTGAIVYGNYTAEATSASVEDDVQRMMDEAAEEEEARLRAEEQALAAIADDVVTMAPKKKKHTAPTEPDLSYMKREPYLGMVDGRGVMQDAYLDPAFRLDDFDEFGVPIRDPVEKRHRRRNTKHPAAARESTLYEGGKLMDIPDVEPGELQTHSEFQSGEEGVRWYAGGRMEHRDLAAEAAARENEDFDPLEDLTHENEEDPYWSLHPRKIRVQITSVVTNSSTNSTAIDYVHKVYDFLRNATDNDPRIGYQIQCVLEEGEAYPGMEDVIQMWLESYNTYHLIDGLAMKDAWGCIMPHIILGKKNLQAILDQVKWALLEDSLDGPLLSPKMRAMRFQGGKENFARGYNTQETFDQHSVVNDT